jgi:hypothetical protein
MAGSTKGYSSHSLRKATHNVDNMTDVSWPFLSVLRMKYVQ